MKLEVIRCDLFISDKKMENKDQFVNIILKGKMVQPKRIDIFKRKKLSPLIQIQLDVCTTKNSI